MVRKIIIPLGTLILLGALLILFLKKENAPSSSEAPAVIKKKTTATLKRTPYVRPTLQELLPKPTPRSAPASRPDSRFNYRMDGFNEIKESLKAASTLHTHKDPEADLSDLASIFNNYLWAYKAMPVGSENAEITLQLLGKNAKHVVFLQQDHPSLNQYGELLDRWGTPYFFHPESEREMGIRSAGPDRTLWTTDDITNDLEANRE